MVIVPGEVSVLADAARICCPEPAPTVSPATVGLTFSVTV